MITLIFSSKNSIGSRIIRLFTWSRWSHVALLCPDNTVIESTAPRVRRVNLADFVANSKEYAIVQLLELDPNPLIYLVSTQLGKKYDYLGALGIGFHRNWQDDSKWICSELIAWGLDKIGHPVFRSEEINKVTPGDFWKLQAPGKTIIVKP
jgi:uncharacterized protein YycO